MFLLDSACDAGASGVARKEVTKMITITRMYVFDVATRAEAWKLLEEEPMEHLDFQSVLEANDEAEAHEHRGLKKLYGK